MKNNLPDQLPNYFDVVASKCRYVASAQDLIVQIFASDIQLSGGAEMARPRIPCPRCGGVKTYKLNGPLTITEWVMQLRFECQDCGQRFLTLWQGEFLRCYDARPIGPRNREHDHAHV